MSSQATTEPDPVILLLAHMVCSDREIHAAEVSFFRNFAEEAGATPVTLAAAELIFSQDPGMQPFEPVCQAIGPHRREDALRKLLAIAYADGCFSPPEQVLLHAVAREWQMQPGVVEAILADAEAMFAKQTGHAAKGVEPPSLGARLIKGVDTSASQMLKKAITQSLG